MLDEFSSGRGERPAAVSAGHASRRGHHRRPGAANVALVPVMALLALHLALPAAADAAATGSGGGGAVRLTLEDALGRAESASVLVRRARAERLAIAAQDEGARVLLPTNPVVAVAAGPRREDAPGSRLDGVQYSGHIEQTVEIAGQRGTRREEVAREVDAARWRETVARAETRARVRASYIGVALADAQLRAALRRLEIAEQLLQAVRTRVETGAASSVDLELARVEHGRVQRDRGTADLALAEALTELRLLIALPPGVGVELATPLAAPPLAPQPLAELLARAIEHRAELRGLGASKLAVDAAIIRLRREVVPSPTLFLDVQRDLPGQVYVGGGLALPLPVWRRNQGELAVARAEMGRLDEERELTGREIGAEVERAYRAVSAQAEIVRVLEGEMLPAAESAVELITQGWRAGKFDLFRVVQASREAGDARRSYLENLGALWAARIALDRAVGAP
jgi:outer membrane protein, heavy metal efflux system